MFNPTDFSSTLKLLQVKDLYSIQDKLEIEKQTKTIKIKLELISKEYQRRKNAKNDRQF